MRIPVGCSIDRATGERTDRYAEGTERDAALLAEAILRAARKGREESRIPAGGNRYEQQNRREAQK